MIFSEDSRVKIPCILHLVRLGYRYLSLKGAQWDEATNIFPALFHEAVARINSDLGEEDRDQQQKIAAVLSFFDAKIDCNNRINAELEAMAKTLYDYWFVQFDFPDANGKPYKSSGGKMVYNATLKREIPLGWGDGSLWDIARYFNGLAMQKYRSTGGEYLPVIKI